LCGITKQFGGVKALDSADFALRAGEIHGLVGENGAGKSTLMMILAGVHTRYGGEVRLEQRHVRFASPKSARAHGIGMIYQELSSVGPLSVAENLCLGHPPRTTLGLINWREMRRQGRAHLDELGLDIDVAALVEDLPLGVQQLIEVARVIHSGARVLVMDEPTSALSPPEIQRLFGLVRRLKQQGNSIVFISHFVDDVLAICDRVTVLRNGRTVATLRAGDAASRTQEAKHDVIQLMLGEGNRGLGESYEHGVALRAGGTGPKVLEVLDAGRGARLSNIRLHVCEGEVVGLYGLMGSGHSLIGRCLYGLERFDAGEILLDGQTSTRIRPASAKARGVAYVSSDRRASLFLTSEVFKNVTVAFLKQLLSIPIRLRKEMAIADAMVERLRILPASSRALLGELSGGNQQKVAFARWLVHPVRALILDEPTRGMDVAAKAEVMRIVKDLRKERVAILLISSEPETILANSDRILVVSKGAIAHEFASETVGKDELMRYA